MSTPPALSRHLSEWLGRWPGEEPIDIVGSSRREEPGWDGRVFPVLGVHSPDTSVLSVPPADAAAVRKGLHDGETWEELLPQLPHLLGREDRIVYSGVFRYCDRPIAPADLPDAGEWIAADHPSVPQWLRPFGHEVLIAWDPETGAYLAGVGIKHHDRYGQEIAVGTEEAARGRGLARRLVAQATRRILDEGAVATYQHDPANLASARVADAAGFPDRGWHSAGMP
jgi:RimJ/RimL family protein N-acetyltransferase